jgi:hypothetical protein
LKKKRKLWSLGREEEGGDRGGKALELEGCLLRLGRCCYSLRTLKNGKPFILFSQRNKRRIGPTTQIQINYLIWFWMGIDWVATVIYFILFCFVVLW